MRYIALLLSVADCSANPSTQAVAEDQFSLSGEWQIAALNGDTLALGHNGQQSVLTFDANGYGGYAGCNGFGGQGLVHEGRFYGGFATSTAMACGTPLDGQESAVQSLLASGPSIEWLGPDRVALAISGQRMELRRSGPLPATRTIAPPIPFIGTYSTFGALDGKTIDMPGARTGPILLVEGDRFTFETPCVVVEGNWSQNGADTVSFSPDVRTPRACNSSSRMHSEDWTGAMQGTLRYVNGPNGEILLAGGGHWMVADLARRGNSEATLLTGRYRIEHGRAATQLNEARPPELILTRNAYYLWDGCNQTEGIAIAFERQLFLHGSGLSTLANCKADSRDGRFKDILLSEPRIGRTPEGLRFSSQVGSVRLRRVGNAPATGGVTSRLGAGMRFSLLSEGGGTLEILPGNRFRLSQSCGITEGRWHTAPRDVDGALRFGPDKPVESCQSDQSAQLAQRAFNGNLDVAIGPNGDIALFAGGFGALRARLETQ